MRKNMEKRIDELNNIKTTEKTKNVGVKSKYEVIVQAEREAFEKLNELEENLVNKIQQLERELKEKSILRNELQAINKANDIQIKQGYDMNKELDYKLNNEIKMNEISNKEHLNILQLKENLNKFKSDEYVEVDKRIKDLENVSSDDPVIQLEFQKNKDYKKKIEALEKSIVETKLRIEELEIQNEYLIKKKEEMIAQRKSFINQNEELRREIDQRNTHNEMRIQKKVKENNSEEINNQEETLKVYIAKADEFQNKIITEYRKTKNIASDILKLNYEIKDREIKKEKVIEVIEEKYKEVDEIKDKVEANREEYETVTEAINKAKVQNEMLRVRNKALNEQYASVHSTLKFMLENFDTSSNLKKISIDDLKSLTFTNTQVNDSINNFVNKVGTFKSAQIQRRPFE